MATNMVQGTASQQASAAAHLERREDWRYVRINGTRYVVLPSARSRSTYWVRDDAAGCSCIWSQKMSSPCSHRIAVRMSMAEDAPKPKARYEDLWPEDDDDGRYGNVSAF